MNIDSTKFPQMSADVWFTDAAGSHTSADTAQLLLTDRGAIVPVTSVRHRLANAPRPSSVVLALAVAVDYEVRKAILEATAATMQASRTEVAILNVEFYNSVLLSDFTADQSAIRDAGILDRFELSCPSAAFTDGYANVFDIARRGRHKKSVIIVFDDDHECLMNVDSVIATARREQCPIYFVMINSECSRTLKTISEQSGGQWFETDWRIDSIKQVMTAILRSAEGRTSVIDWTAEECAVASHNIELMYLDIQRHDTYWIDDVRGSELSFSPFRMTLVVPSGQPKKDTVVRATANRGVWNVDSVTSTDPSFHATPSSFDLAAGESVDVTITFTPPYMGRHSTFLSFHTPMCTARLEVVGGNSNSGISKDTVRVTNPIGGEVYAIGDTIPIRWGGIPVGDSVELEISSDSDRNWRQIAINAKGGVYRWKIPNNLINDTARQYIRVSRIEANTLDGNGLMFTPYKTYRRGFWSPDGTRILDKNATVPNVRSVDVKTGAVSYEKFIRGEPFYQSNDFKQLLLFRDDSLVPYNLETLKEGKPILNLYGSYHCAYNPLSTKYLLQAYEIIQVVDAKSSTTVMNIDFGDHDLGPVSWSSDGNQIVTQFLQHAENGVKGKAGFAIWNTITRTVNTRVRDTIPREVFWTDSDSLIVITENDSLFIYNVPENRITLSKEISTNGAFASHDRSQLAITQRNGGLAVLDMKTLDVVHEWKMESDTFGVQPLLTWSPDGSKLSVVYSKFAAEVGTVLFLDVYSGDTVYITTDLGSHTALYFSPSSNEFASFAANQMAAWRLPSVLCTTGTSNSFRVFSPYPILSPIDMGKVGIGDFKDSTVAGAIVNIQQAPYTIKSVRRWGKDSSEFTILAAPENQSLSPTDSAAIRLVFTPNSVGPKQAALRAATLERDFILNVTGEGFVKPVTFSESDIDFGPVGVAGSTTTSRSITLRNQSPTTVRVDELMWVNSMSTDFSFDSTIIGAELSPQESVRLSISFKPTQRGRVSDKLSVNYSTDRMWSNTVRTRGEGFVESSAEQARAEVGMAAVSAARGDTIVVPITILSDSNLAYTGVDKLFVHLTADWSQVTPVADDGSTLPLPDGKLTLALPTTPTTNSIAASQRFIIQSPRDSVIYLSLTQSEETEDRINLTCSDGAIHVHRRDTPTTPASQLGEPRPNPVIGDLLEVPVVVLDQGQALFSLRNLCGTVLQQIAIEPTSLAAPTVSINVAGLGAGCYLLSLETSAATHVRTFLIIR